RVHPVRSGRRDAHRTRALEVAGEEHALQGGRLSRPGGGDPRGSACSRADQGADSRVKPFADRLFAAVQSKESAVVVGLDPDPRFIPASLLPRSGSGARQRLAAGVSRFLEEIVAAVASAAVAVKPQLAYFERLGPPGFEAYERIVACAREHGLIVIADGKRNDIAATAEQYAAAYLGEKQEPAGTENDLGGGGE